METHFWWPDLPADMREGFRVLKTGGMFVIVAEICRGAGTARVKLAEKCFPMSGMKLLTVSEHQDLFADAGFTHIQTITESRRGWICAVGKKPSMESA